MQLLFEEFFKKVYGYTKGGTNSLMLILTIRIMIYGFFILFVGFVIYAIWKGMYVLLGILIGLIILGEGSHFIRKSREKIAHKKAPKDASMEHAADAIKASKSKNNKLLRVTRDKNKNLLKGSKAKNKKLLSKQ